MDKFLYFQLYNLGHTSIGDAEPLVTKSILFHKMFWLFDVQINFSSDLKILGLQL